MSTSDPVLITGAAGEIGGVSRTVVDMLLERGHAVRAFVRQDDQRAHSLRQSGAEVVVGDLLNISDVASALKGCRRVYFSMSLSPYYSEAVSVMTAAARAQEDIEAFVNISEYEQSFMTFETMTAPAEQRRAHLGGLVENWSPQQRAHWIAEQVLEWSGVPTVNIRAAIFVENPILTMLASAPLARGELHLPFGEHPLAPIAAFDVAEVCANILHDPAPHTGRSYSLTGPESKTMYALAEDYTAVLGRPVVYVPQDIDEWIRTFIDDSPLANIPHTAEHLATLARLIAGGGYRGKTTQLEQLLDRDPKTPRWALAQHPRIRALGMKR